MGIKGVQSIIENLQGRPGMFRFRNGLVVSFCMSVRIPGSSGSPVGKPSLLLPLAPCGPGRYVGSRGPELLSVPGRKPLPDCGRINDMPPQGIRSGEGSRISRFGRLQGMHSPPGFHSGRAAVLYVAF